MLHPELCHKIWKYFYDHKHFKISVSSSAVRSLWKLFFESMTPVKARNPLPVSHVDNHARLQITFTMFQVTLEISQSCSSFDVKLYVRIYALLLHLLTAFIFLLYACCFISLFPHMSGCLDVNLAPMCCN